MIDGGIRGGDDVWGLRAVQLVGIDLAGAGVVITAADSAVLVVGAGIAVAGLRPYAGRCIAACTHQLAGAFVEFRDALPDTFTDEVEVVLEGKLRADGGFEATTLLTKCGSRYEAAPEDLAREGTSHPEGVPYSSGN